MDSAPSTVALRTAFRRERFCRLCMGLPDNNRLQRFFDGGTPANPDLLKHIRSLVNVEIVFPDDQHSEICSRCLHSLENFFVFRNLCQTVDVRVRKMRVEKAPAPPEVDPDPVFEVPLLPPPPPPSELEETMGIFECLEFCHDPADEPEEYRLVMKGFVYSQKSLTDWLCEVESCGCRLDVDKDLSDCRPLTEHATSRRKMMDGNVSRLTGRFCSTVNESVVNIESYQQNADPEQMPELPVLQSVDVPQPEVAFFNCLERGLSMVRGRYHYLLAQVQGGRSMWLCTWTDCKVILEANSQLTAFRTLSEHSHDPPSQSALKESTANQISQDGAFAELTACPANDGQVAQPEVTFYRAVKSGIGVQHDGFCFRLGGFFAGGKSRWGCVWHGGCSVELELAGTLQCRLVPAGEPSHGHPRPEPVCSMVNTVSPVKALVELNGKRSVMEQQSGVHEILQGRPQLELKLTKVQVPATVRHRMDPPPPPKMDFYRIRRTLSLQFEGARYLLARYSSKGDSRWACVRVSPQKCPVRIILNREMDLVSNEHTHNHRRTRCIPLGTALNAKQISPQEVARELKDNRGSSRENKRRGILEVYDGRRIVRRTRLVRATSAESMSVNGSSLGSSSCSSVVQ
ncbi:hypothetical protein pipiens_010073 [Culex pipiens pipiens]|uniref:ZAD domain-containing protein n=1 Tax=Culex pipiens pipiens TaxID=38569 RepID=A0ABD1DBI9_CULPP